MSLFSKIATVVNPVTSLTDKLLKSGGSNGPDNPYAPPDLSYLRNPGNEFDFLKNQVNGQSSPYFTQLINSINAPSSVDAVRNGLDAQGLANLNAQTDTATNQALGSGAGGYLRRGLISPQSGGVSSDIASAGLGNIAAQGATTKANNALTYSLADLDRLKARETAAQQAYGQQYQTESGLASNYANLLNSRDTAYATGSANLYDAGQKNQIAGYRPSYFDQILGGVSKGFGNALGSKLGG